MNQKQTYGEHLADQLFVLSVFNQMDKTKEWQDLCGIMGAITVASKVIFQKNIKGFNLPLLICDINSFRNSIYEILHILTKRNLISINLKRTNYHSKKQSGGVYYKITDKGKHVFSGYKDLLTIPFNSQIFNNIFNEIDKFTNANNGEVVTIEKLLKDFDLISISTLNRTKKKISFHIDDDWFDVVDMMFSEDYDPQAMKRGSNATYKELFEME